MEKLEEMVTELFGSVEFSEEFKEYVVQTAKEIISEVRQTESKEEKHLKQMISKTKQRMKNAEDDRLDRLINRDEFADIYNRLKDDLEQAHTGLAEIQKDHTKTISILNDVLALSEDIHQTYIDATPEQKRKYLQLFFEKIEVDDGKIVGTTFTPVISQLIEIDRVRIRKQWRRAWDSNPRAPKGPTDFESVPL